MDQTRNPEGLWLILSSIMRDAEQKIYVYIHTCTHIYIICLYFVHVLNLTFLWNQFYALLLSAWATINYFGVGSYFLQAGLHFFWGTLLWFKFTFLSFLLGCEMLIFTISNLPSCHEPSLMHQLFVLCETSLSMLLCLSWALCALCIYP